MTLDFRLPMYDKPDTVSVCVPHPIIHTFLKISRRQTQIVMTLNFLVTFKSYVSFQNVYLVTISIFLSIKTPFLCSASTSLRIDVLDRNDLDLWTVTKYSTSKNSNIG